MLEAGARRLRGSAREQIATRQMDAHALPLPDVSLDAAFCAFGMRNLSDVPLALGERWTAIVPLTIVLVPFLGLRATLSI